jgi:hypothetical protein
MSTTTEYDIIGSYKQLEWGRVVKSRFLEQLDSLSQTHQFTFDDFCVISHEEIKQMILEEKSAKFFIDRRNMSILDLCKLFCLRRLELKPNLPSDRVDCKTEAAFLLSRTQKFQAIIQEREAHLIAQVRKISSLSYAAGLDRDLHVLSSHSSPSHQIENMLDQIIDLNRQLLKTINQLSRSSNT